MLHKNDTVQLGKLGAQREVLKTLAGSEAPELTSYSDLVHYIGSNSVGRIFKESLKSFGTSVILPAAIAARGTNKPFAVGTLQRSSRHLPNFMSRFLVLDESRRVMSERKLVLPDILWPPLLDIEDFNFIAIERTISADGYTQAASYDARKGTADISLVPHLIQHAANSLADIMQTAEDRLQCE